MKEESARNELLQGGRNFDRLIRWYSEHIGNTLTRRTRGRNTTIEKLTQTPLPRIILEMAQPRKYNRLDLTVNQPSYLL